jgi:hypothetical protein
MSNTTALATAFKSLAKRPTPPPLLQALSYSERKCFDKAITIYTVLPESPSELRQTFHCTLASAVKIYGVLAEYFNPQERIKK